MSLKFLFASYNMSFHQKNKIAFPQKKRNKIATPQQAYSSCQVEYVIYFHTGIFDPK